MSPASPLRHPGAVRAAFLVAILAVAGCSSSKGGDAKGATSSTVKGTVTTVRPVDTSFTGQGSADFCAFITTFTKGSQSVSATATPAELEASFRENLAAINQAVAAAPAEIKGDVQSLADTFETVTAALSKAGFNISQVDTSVLQALQSESFLDSVTRMQAYLTKFCGTG